MKGGIPYSGTLLLSLASEKEEIGLTDTIVVGEFFIESIARYGYI